MKSSETTIVSIDNTTASIGTPCLICGDTVSIASYYAGPKICDKCKEAVLSVRASVKSNEHPCTNCNTGWGSASSKGVTTCDETCEKLAAWRRRMLNM